MIARDTAEWRRLHFESIDDCVREVQQIREADQTGRLRAIGNWTPGQILAHIAAWIEYGYEGYPISPPPFFVRWILRWRLKSILSRGMPRGVRIPRVEGGTSGMDKLPTAEAVDRLLAALARLQRAEQAPFDSPAFGRMSHDDRIRLNLRHAELHLGYLVY
ncbi:MAG: DUF1569 domain-containing protein [Pirellulaceae bacterium]